MGTPQTAGLCTHTPELRRIVPHMTHSEWIDKHARLSGELGEVHARRDELQRNAEHIPGPVLQKRDQELDRRELDLLDQLAALMELDSSGAVS